MIGSSSRSCFARVGRPNARSAIATPLAKRSPKQKPQRLPSAASLIRNSAARRRVFARSSLRNRVEDAAQALMCLQASGNRWPNLMGLKAWLRWPSLRCRCPRYDRGPAPASTVLTSRIAMSIAIRPLLRALLPIAFASAAPFGAVPAQAADDIAAGSLTNSPPMIAYAADGTTLQGMIVDLAAAMSKQMGRTIVFKPMAFPALIPALEAKSIDIAFTVMNDTPEREQVLDFVD